MPTIDVEQRSPEWLKMRCGAVTGSRVGDVITKLKKGGYSSSRQTYLMELVCERLSGLHADHYVSPAMEFGMENESCARAEYELQCEVDVKQIGLAMHDKINYFMASPDGLVGEDGCIEIKVPNSMTHLNWLICGEVPPEHVPQMKAVMCCANRQWCDFVSFDPRMPKDLRLFVRRLYRDGPMILEMEQEVEKFLAEVEAAMQRALDAKPIIRALESLSRPEAHSSTT